MAKALTVGTSGVPLTKATKMFDTNVKGIAQCGELIVVEYLQEASGDRQLLTVDFGTAPVVAYHTCSATIRGVSCWHLGVAVMVRARLVNIPAEKMCGMLSFMSICKAPDLTRIPKRGYADLTHYLTGRASDWVLFHPIFDVEPKQFIDANKGVGVPSGTLPLLAGEPSNQESAACEVAPKPEPPSRKKLAGAMEVKRYLQAQGIPKGLRDAISEMRGKQYHHDRVRDGSRRYEGGMAMAQASASMLLGKNLMLVGPKGTGKNVLAETLSWTMGLPYFELNGNAGITEEKITGEKTLTSGMKGPEVTFQLGNLARAMQDGGLLMVDEFNTLRPEVAVLFHGLDHRRRIEIPGYGLVDAHENFRFVACMNVGYAGTFEVNAASLDRMVVIDLSYPEDIASIIERESKLTDKAILNKMAKVFKILKGAHEQNQLTEATVTLRGYIDAGDLISIGIPARDAFIGCVVNKTFDDDERKRVLDIWDKA